jgi:hypothetical protein
MTRNRAVTFVAGALLTAVVAAPRDAAAFWTVMRAAGSTCEAESGKPVDGWASLTDFNISTTQAGRLQSLSNTDINQSLYVYCPVVDIPVVLDITDLSKADRVTVLINQGANAAVAGREGRAQLCSEDNSGSTMGGSCDGPQLAASGAGVRAVNIVMSSGTNWQLHADSLHYIAVFVPPGTVSSPGYAYFSGYTIWHS